MTDKRYYYDCPLIAAYMTEYFNIKIYIIEEQEEFNLDVHELMNEPPISVVGINIKYYLHPESHPILKPQEGDIMIGPGSMCVNVEYIDYHTLNNPRVIDKKLLKGKIIQRNGRPFHWPKEGRQSI